MVRIGQKVPCSADSLDYSATLGERGSLQECTLRKKLTT